MAGGFPLGTRVELDLDGWVDVTGRVYARDPVSITRGRSADASSTDPASCRFTLDNRDDRFSMRNPLGPYYGLLRRNIPVRVSLPAEVPGMHLRYNNPTLHRQSKASAADVAGFAIAGDLDVRAEIDADQWAWGHLVGKFLDVDGSREWIFYVENGCLTLLWSPAGTVATQTWATSRVLFSDTGPARRAVRASLAFNNGAGNWAVTFYTAPTLAGPWVAAQTVTGTGTTSVVNGPAPIEVGNVFDYTGYALPGRMLAAEVRTGGTLIASPNFRAQAVGTTSFADAQGNAWTLGADAEITDRDVRFYGEVSQWPQSRDVAGVDKTIAVTAYGQRRRLALNAPALDSVMVREFASPRRGNIVAYWPMEEAAGATRIASAFPGAPAMNVYGKPELAVYPDWPSSKPLPKMRTGEFLGRIPRYDSSTNTIQVRLFMDMDTAPGGSIEANLFTLWTSTMLWYVDTQPGGNVQVWALSLDQETTYHTGVVTPVGLENHGFVSVNFLVQQSGANVTYALTFIDFQSDQVWNTPIPFIVNPLTGTLSGRSIGRATQISVGRGRNLGDVAVGHLAVANSQDAYAGTAGALNTWNGESAEERIFRLSREDGIAVRLNDQGGYEGYRNGHHLGDQTADTWLALMDEAETSDLGLLFEPRDGMGFVYRNRWGMTNQDARVSLDYNAGQIAGELQPVDDDDALRNDVTVSRTSGGSARAEDTESALSVLPPPLGVGRYSDSVEISAQADEWLPSQAAFRLRKGTVDAARYPTLLVELHNPRVTDDLAHRVRALDIGDRIDIQNADGWTPNVPLIVTGYQEDLQVTTHRFTFNVTPGEPWTAAVVDADRYDTAGSELATPPPPTPVAPAFVEAKPSYQNLSSVVVPTVAAPMVVVCLTWNTVANVTAPAGWTLRKMLTASTSRAAVFTAPGTVANWTFAFTDATTGAPVVCKTSIVALGYSASDVSAVDGVLDVGTDGIHEAPALAVPAGPARLVRFYWDKASTTTAWTANDAGATVRGSQFGTGSGSNALLGTDQIMSAGTAPLATATANLVTGQAGGFTLALFATPTAASDVSETDTAIAVSTTLGPVWTTDLADFPLGVMVGGERMTLVCPGTQLAVNPLMSGGTAGWAAQSGTIAYDTVTRHPDGAASLRMTPDNVSASGGVVSASRVPITAGASYTVAGWFYSPTAWADLRPCVDWYDASGVFLSTAFGNGYAVPAAGWTHLKNTLTAPAGAALAVVRARFAGGPTSAVFYVWRLVLVPTASISAVSPQTFTVTRAVNGVHKRHAAGTDVALADPAYAML